MRNYLSWLGLWEMARFKLLHARNSSRKTTDSSESNDLALCAVFRDQAPYLDEWIKFHIAQGVSHFFLYDHESSDSFREVLAPWQSIGAVTLMSVKKRTQDQVYSDCLRLARPLYKWLGFLDIDEFLFSPDRKLIGEILRAYDSFSAVFVFWKLFGSGMRDFQDSLGVLETFTSCLESPETPKDARVQLEHWLSLHAAGKPVTGKPIQGKSLVNLEKVSKMGIHFPAAIAKGTVVDEKTRPILNDESISALYTSEYVPSLNTLRINHYWSRGQQALVHKIMKPGLEKVPRDLKGNSVRLEAAREWESKLNSSRDYTVLKSWRPVSAPKVFLIGFNKTATRAFTAFFEANGFPAIHWDYNKLTQRMVLNLSEGKKVLDGYDLDYKFFSDFTYLTESESVEGNSFFREMDSHYPDSYFILNNRKTSDWILSRERHNSGDILNKYLSLMRTSNIEAVRTRWVAEKKNHELAVRGYFNGRNNFLEIDIDSQDIPGQISRFLEMEFDHSLWQVVGKT